MRWLPSRAHDNGMFLIFSNGVGVDDDGIRTGNTHGTLPNISYQEHDARRMPSGSMIMRRSR